MKYLLLVILIVLIASSILTAWHIPDAISAVPVIRWVTDNNPARSEQIRMFNEWIKQDDRPRGVLRIDATNADPTKKIIQSVSGVAADVMDVTSTGQLNYFNQIGFLQDVTEEAKRLGYDPSHTFPAVKPALGVTDDDGNFHQLLYPCNVSVNMFIVNREAFRRFHQPEPPKRWTIDDYEKRGLAYVEAANPPGQRHQFFFSIEPSFVELRRSLGVGDFDETQTHCTLDDPRYADLLNRMARWRRLHIIPTAADEASFADANSGYGGLSMHLFDTDNYAMLDTGRYLVIAFREKNIGRQRSGQPPLEVTAVEPPNGGFPEVDVFVRAASVYKGSANKELACYFQAFLASDEYNRQIIHDGDSLPPNPALTQSEEFLHPPVDPARGVFKETEWDFHSAYAEAAKTIAVARSISPFILGSVFDREDARAKDHFLDGEDMTAEQAVHEATVRINDEIARSLNENPSLRPRYDALCKQQAEISSLKAAGRKIPLKLIIDPYCRQYEQAQGMTE